MKFRVRAGNRLRLALVALTLGATTLLFGGVEIPAQLPLILVGGALLCWSLLGRDPRAESQERSAGPAFFLLLAAVVTLAVVQLVPVPSILRGILAPGGEKVVRAVLPGGGESPSGWRELFAHSRKEEPEPLDTASLWNGARTAAPAPSAPAAEIPAGPSGFRPLSVVPGATAASLALVLGYFGLFFAAVPVARRQQTLAWAVDALLALGLLVAIVGLAQDVSNTKAYFGIRTFSPHTTPYGPFANRNHFGAFVAAILPIAAFTALDRLDRAFSRPHRRREDAVNAYSRVFVHAFVALVLAAALVRCLSRGALLASAVGLLVGVLLLRGAGLSSRSLAVGAALALTAAGGVVLMAADREGFRRRSQETLESPDGRRLELASAGLRHFRDFPVFGSGLGTFPYTSSLHRPPTGAAEVQRAHNDYLEALAENGIAGGLLVLAAVGLLVREAYRARLAARRRDRALVAALTAGLVGLLVHAAADFHLQVPAVAALLAVEAGVLVGIARTRQRDVATDESWGEGE